MELLGLDADTPLSITTDGKALIIHPVHDEKRDERFRAALEKVNERHAGALRRLAE
ncbi:MAG: AbrB/MazE/SpoVT family DNA-binding domain-containing protein [Candidatus Eremiobacterota bacterium]